MASSSEIVSIIPASAHQISKLVIIPAAVRGSSATTSSATASSRFSFTAPATSTRVSPIVVTVTSSSFSS